MRSEEQRERIQAVADSVSPGLFRIDVIRRGNPNYDVAVSVDVVFNVPVTVRKPEKRWGIDVEERKRVMDAIWHLIQKVEYDWQIPWKRDPRGRGYKARFFLPLRVVTDEFWTDEEYARFFSYLYELVERMGLGDYVVTRRGA